MVQKGGVEKERVQNTGTLPSTLMPARARSLRRSWGRWGWPTLGLLILLGCWPLASLLLGAEIFPGPVATLKFLHAEVLRGALWGHVGITLWRVLTSFALALPVGGGVLTVSLSPDALIADDTAQLVLRPRPAALRVAVIGPQIDEIERGLAALPNVTVSHATGLNAGLNAEADLLVVTQPGLQGSGLQGAAQRPTLWLNAAAGSNGLDVPSAWDTRSPLGRGVRWADLTVGSPVSSSPAGNLAPWPELDFGH